jgi:hypothetical protein
LPVIGCAFGNDLHRSRALGVGLGKLKASAFVFDVDALADDLAIMRWCEASRTK